MRLSSQGAQMARDFPEHRRSHLLPNRDASRFCEILLAQNDRLPGLPSDLIRMREFDEHIFQCRSTLGEFAHGPVALCRQPKHLFADVRARLDA